MSKQILILPGDGIGPEIMAEAVKVLGLFANLRPAILYPQLADASSLKPEVVAGLDILIVRELTGGIYFGQPRESKVLENGERMAYDTLPYSESEIRRIARV